jgi:hypothetical protein
MLWNLTPKIAGKIAPVKDAAFKQGIPHGAVKAGG